MSAARHERLMNLLFVLLNTKRPVSRDEIKMKVPGYSISQTAFERMFERDKEDLRQASVEVKAIPIDGGFDDQLGYVVEGLLRDEISVAIGAREISLLRLAAQAWRDPEARVSANRGVIKLESAPATPTSPVNEANPSKTDPKLGIGSLNAKCVPIAMALNDGVVLSFKYRKPTEMSTSTRTVEPWRLYGDSGVWYMQGFDLNEQASRTFRLSRMASVPVLLDATVCKTRSKANCDEGKEGDSQARPLMATIWIDEYAPGEVQRTLRNNLKGEIEFMFGERRGFKGVMDYWDARNFAASLMAFAPHLIVLAPSELRSEMAEQAKTAMQRIE